MKKIILILCFLGGMNVTLRAQTKKSVAVANPHVEGLYATPTIAAKIIRLELIKLDQYAVYDEFDMQEVYDKDSSFLMNCWSKNCLENLGKELHVDYAVSGSFDRLGKKIVISLKMIDVVNGAIYKKAVREFEDQEVELQRMTELVLREMHGLTIENESQNRLKYNDEPITHTGVGKINNSGPRVGFAVMTGDLVEFARRPADQGGLDVFPALSMIGYQVEGQYVGTEHFSGLVEGIFNVSGLEQGLFIPTVSVLNGFRFGDAGWEFAFGPSFGLKRESRGFFDSDASFGEAGRYYNEDDWKTYASRRFRDENLYPEYYENGQFSAPSPMDFNDKYNFNSKHSDTRGSYKLSPSFLIAFGRTFHAGALNIPVNVFYSSKKGGGLLGVNVGFNIMNSKREINQNTL